MVSSVDEIKKIYFNKFSDCISNFSNCSYNDAGTKPLVASTKPCFNFDLIKEIMFLGRTSVCSVDSIAFDIGNDTILFIEFKDSKFKACKENFIQSAQDSFLTHRLIVSFFGEESLNKVRRKCILVLDETKNSSFITSYYASKRSNKLDENLAYLSLKRKLLDTNFFDVSFYDEIEICTQSNFDEIVKKI